MMDGALARAAHDANAGAAPADGAATPVAAGGASASAVAALRAASPASPAPDRDVLCPVCHEVIREAFMTRCGHSFCYLCIVQHLDIRKDCPTCKGPLSRDGIFPNFLLNRLLSKQAVAGISSASPVQQIHETLSREKDLKIADINNLLGTLLDAKRRLEAEERELELDLLHDFLVKAKEQKTELMARLAEEVHYLDEDLQTVERERSTTRDLAPSAAAAAAAAVAATVEEVPSLADGDGELGRKRVRLSDVGKRQTHISVLADVAGMKKKRMLAHFDDLQASYYDCRRAGAEDALRQFSESLGSFTRYSRYNVLATLKYGDMFNASSIVSSIEFDRDDEYFATAGVTKKIKIFEYANIVNEVAEVHFPMREMSCRSKISCLSWNSYIKSQIASSDYEGIITLWDASTGQMTMQFEEHEKRAWSVDFSRTDPRLLVSASDDTTAKLWTTNTENSTMTIESKANICCAKFNPESAHNIAFGSADHHIHYYDLRRPREPLYVLKGHRKAVSYVKFLNRSELVSASTDSTLKLWSVDTGACRRTFTGHTNEKNFVGLTANGDYITCGSEKNALYTYYKAVSKPVVHYKFGSSNPLTGEESEEDEGQFVSSVCWKKGTNVVLAANSQGTIKIMELV